MCTAAVLLAGSIGNVAGAAPGGQTSQTTTTTQKTTAPRKAVRKKRPAPKPPKPIPLAPLEPVPIETGDGNPLGTFFQALANLQSTSGDASSPQVVRVIHFGDSHTASDYWAGVLRQKLQERFGNAGPGFVLPGRPWSTIRYADAQSLDGQGWRTDNLRYTEQDGVVGLGGMSIESYREASPASLMASFSKFDVLLATRGDDACPIRVTADGEDVSNLASQREQIYPPAPESGPVAPDPGTPPASPSPANPAAPALAPAEPGKSPDSVPPETPKPPTAENLVPEPSSHDLGGGAADSAEGAAYVRLISALAPGEPALLTPVPAPLSPVQSRRRRRVVKPKPITPPYKAWPDDAPLDLLDLSSSAPLPEGSHKLSIYSSCGSNARVLGAELYSGSKGVLYDTDGVNGARLVDLEKARPPLRQALLKQAQPTLIIVSYGTNDIGTKGFTSADYEERAFQILTKLKQDAGGAAILVTGPTDRGYPRRVRRVAIQAAQAELQPALRKAALRAGCAYYDQQAAMGGPGSMTRWVRAGLAAYDYVHFSGAGYQKLAGMLFDQLMESYTKWSQAAAPPAQ